MSPRITPLLAALSCFAFPVAVLAQIPPEVAVEEQRSAIEKLTMMIGRWEGTGWIVGPQGRMEFRGSEHVQLKLHGVALLVEGAFFHRDPATGEEKPSHTTLGVINFDPKSQTYRFRSWLATGTSGEHELQLTDDGWRWEMSFPGRMIRYTTRFEAQQWIEIGEMSADGANWRQFFAMTLTKLP